jgi:hypothetical protein
VPQQNDRIRQAFVAFHVTLGLALLWASVHTVLHLGPTDPHARVVGTMEAMGAAAFLIPATLQLGAVLLLLSVIGALVVHAAAGEFRPDLLVYAAGVLLVALHGSAYRHLPPSLSHT